MAGAPSPRRRVTPRRLSIWSRQRVDHETHETHRRGAVPPTNLSPAAIRILTRQQEPSSYAEHPCIPVARKWVASPPPWFGNVESAHHRREVGGAGKSDDLSKMVGANFLNASTRFRSKHRCQAGPWHPEWRSLSPAPAVLRIICSCRMLDAANSASLHWLLLAVQRSVR
jgi:hypothetical protein